MAFKTIVSLEADTTITLGGKDKKTGKSNPTKAEGYYLGRRAIAPGKYSRPGKQDYLYFLQTSEGNLAIWGKTDLDRKMGNVAPGTMVRLSHVGMTPTPNGDMHKYKVEVDDTNTIDVSGLQPNTANLQSETSEEDPDIEDDDQEEDEQEEEAPRAASSSAADRRAKVAALLSKNK